MPSLAELKALIKSHQGDKPKLSAGKESLLLYAEKQGLLKKSEAVPVVHVAKEPIVKSRVKKESEPLPAILKKPVEQPAEKKTARIKETESIVSSKKEPSGFAAFMSANRGSGLSMSTLATKYRESK